MRQATLIDTLTAGWSFASTEATVADPHDAASLDFQPAQVPGTVASALRDLGRWRHGAEARFDDSEHWFRCRFRYAPALAGEEVLLRCEGISTVAEIWLNGARIGTSTSMFAEHMLDVTALLREDNDLFIVCRSLTAALKLRRAKAPMARWRTRVVVEQQLRWFRTTMLGRAPGFAAEPAPVGPWRPVSLVRRQRVAVDSLEIQAALHGSKGHVRASFRGRALTASIVTATLRIGDHVTDFMVDTAQWTASIDIDEVTLWFPHTHGTPHRYPVAITAVLDDGAAVTLHEGYTGFRKIEAAPLEHFAINVNGLAIFARGVVWTPIDPIGLGSSRERVRQRLEALREAGFNLIRVAGTMVYEDESFHDLLDELGLLLWQDLMFANFDYPFEDPSFHELVTAEARHQLTRLSPHASTAVICGNSEVEQQATMNGLPSAVARISFFDQELPAMVASLCPQAAYVPSAPTGGDLPFRTNRGVANYFGVGAYLRPLEDARTADVRFASECLAFSNVPEPETVEEMSAAARGGISPTHPAWKRAVPRDAGASWDFEDVRDHYLKLLYGIDPTALRYADLQHYYELSRMTSGEVMAAVFGEWRRAASSCAGGIVLWGCDLENGAGWGLIDAQGREKAAYWLLKRTLSPRAIWMTNEGLNGVDIHVSHDAASAATMMLRVALYRREQRVDEAAAEIVVPAYGSISRGVEQVLGRFVDASYAYRFGPPAHDLIVAALFDQSSAEPLAQAAHFPLGRPATREAIGLRGEAQVLADGGVEVLLQTQRLAYGTRVYAAGYRPDDAYFTIEPGGHRRITLTPATSHSKLKQISVTAVNSPDRILIPWGAHL